MSSSDGESRVIETYEQIAGRQHLESVLRSHHHRGGLLLHQQRAVESVAGEEVGAVVHGGRSEAQRLAARAEGVDLAGRCRYRRQAARLRPSRYQRRQGADADDPELGQLHGAVGLDVAEQTIVLALERGAQRRHVRFRIRHPHVPLLARVAEIGFVLEAHRAGLEPALA